MQKPDFISAIHSLSPKACFTLEDVTNIETLRWATSKPDTETDVPFVGAAIESVDFAMPSAEEIKAELERLTAEYEYFSYQIERQYKYPPIGDQLDALYHAGVFPADMAEQIQAVKDAYPKPTGDDA